MKTSIVLALFVLLSILTYAQTTLPLAIIPEPVNVQRLEGRFTLVAATGIEAQKASAPVAAWFANKIQQSTGFVLTVSDKRGDGTPAIRFVLAPDAAAKKEQYRLQTGPSGVVITAAEPAGLFYGAQTLLQLFPPAISSKTPVTGVEWLLPAVDITDYPRFAWRGLMFDVARHFFNKEQVEEFIDEMASYKFNILHLHLSEDQGWRLEIKSYPKLTSVGAWNVKKTGTFGTFSEPLPDEPRNFGGFYTQDDMREIIAYAQQRFVNILPELDMPGHSLAAIASYPELSCTPGDYKVNSGEKFMIWPPKGHFYGLIDNTLCPANEKVYTFLDKVFTEVAALFPFGYIHMGGDETARNFWEKTDAIKALMKKENLKDLDEVQAYFVKRVQKIIESKGKKMIGWDEILEGGLSEKAAVMSWRGVKGGIEATQKGHMVVMSPSTFAYLDFMQSDPAVEPPVYSSLRLKTTYAFDPIAEGVNEKLILGGQANLWTEQIYNMHHLQYMLWPRAFAIAEDVWSQPSAKNWNRFVAKVENHFQRYQAAGIKYAPSMYDPTITVAKDSGGALSVNFENEIEGLDVYYSFDNSYPDSSYARYNNTPVAVPKDAVLMRAITYRQGKPVGRMMNLSKDEMLKRAK